MLQQELLSASDFNHHLSSQETETHDAVTAEISEVPPSAVCMQTPQPFVGPLLALCQCGALNVDLRIQWRFMEQRTLGQFVIKQLRTEKTSDFNGKL